MQCQVIRKACEPEIERLAIPSPPSFACHPALCALPMHASAQFCLRGPLPRPKGPLFSLLLAGLLPLIGASCLLRRRPGDNQSNHPRPRPFSLTYFLPSLKFLAPCPLPPRHVPPPACCSYARARTHRKRTRALLCPCCRCCAPCGCCAPHCLHTTSARCVPVTHAILQTAAHTHTFVLWHHLPCPPFAGRLQ